jgi:signal transduction protein with GAF and PtsI domain
MIDDVITNPDRLAALYQTGLLDTPSGDAFNQLARLAMRLMEAPVALISLVDRDRQFFHTCIGSFGDVCEGGQTPVKHSFCQHTVATKEPFIIDDARGHPLLKDNPAVTEYGVIAYAGIPLITRAGHAIGSLCVLDSKARNWRSQDVEALKSLALAVSSTISVNTSSGLDPHPTPGAQHAAVQSAKDVELERAVGALLAALEKYNDLLAYSPSHAAALAIEATLQSEIVQAELTLSVLSEHLNSMAGTLSAAHQRLLAAAITYGEAKRRRSQAAQDFQQLRASLAEVDRAGRPSLDSEQKLKHEWLRLMPD